MPAQSSTVKIGEVAIRVHRAGQGPKLLFLHGAGGYAQWLPFLDALADGYEVILPEHPGFGASDDPDWIRSVPDLAMFYLDFLEHEGIREVHLVGHSLGGWIAAEIAVRDRSRFKSLTLIAPAGIRVRGVLAGDTFIWSHEEAVRNLFHDETFAAALLALPLSEAQQDVMLKNRFAATKLGWQPRWFNPDLEKWLHRAKLPALIVWGAQDKVMPPEYAALWQERLPDARLVIIEECGHLPHVEKEAATSRAVREFLKGAAR